MEALLGILVLVIFAVGGTWSMMTDISARKDQEKESDRRSRRVPDDYDDSDLDS